MAKNRNYPDENFVVKIIDISDDSPPEQLITYKAECDMLLQLSHPNVISVFGNFTSENFSYMILEYCPGGSIKDILEKYHVIPPPQLYILTKQIIQALKFCHDRHIAHRDVKPGNILIDKYERAKLADFGLSLQIQGSSNKINQFAGSRYYMAPEQLNKQPFDPFLADIWAAGVTFFEMAIGYLPWEAGTIPNIIEIFKTTKIPQDVSPLYFRMIQGMLNVDPSKRLSLSQILTIDLFKESPKKRILKQDPNTVRPLKAPSSNNLLKKNNIMIKPISVRHHLSLKPTFSDNSLC